MELGKRLLTLFVVLFFCVSSASAACGNSVSTSAKSTCPKLTSSVSTCALKAPCGACVPKIAGSVAGKKVSFKGSGAGATAFSWNFGDKTISRSQNPVHTYKKAGTYKVCLSVKCGSGWLSTCKTVKV